MGIFLLILKIIGITLLCIIGLIIAVLLLILFVPVRYNITVSNQQGNGKLYARARVTWLLHLINCLVSYYEELYYRVRVIIFKLISSDKQEEKKRTHRGKEIKKSDSGNDNDTKPSGNADSVDTPHLEDQNIEEHITESAGDAFQSAKMRKAKVRNDDAEDIETEFTADDTDDAEYTEDIDADPENEESEEKQKLFDKIKDVLQKIIDVIFNIPDKITTVINKINDIRDNIEYYINAVNDERNKEAFNRCLEELVKILKSISPRKLTGNLLIGREDPYDYGQMSGILGIAYPFIHDKIKIETRNDEDITSYYVYTKGRVTVFVLLVAFIRIYFNRDIKRMIKIFKHEGR